MEKSEILRHLREFLSSQKEDTLDKKTIAFYATLRTVGENQISFGEQPRYFYARIECNSTGVGESSFEGTKTQRTVAKDFITDEMLFIDGHEGAASKGISLFLAKEGQIVYYKKKSAIETIADLEGRARHRQDFSDLNMRMTDHRVNRYTTHLTRKPFTYPIRPVFAKLSEKEEDTATLGYVYEMNDAEYIIVEPQAPAKPLNKAKLALWIALGIICPPILIAGLILWLIKD